VTRLCTHEPLLHQGALAFETWFDKPAPVEAMRDALLEFRKASSL
jgi:shikimate 5-dehydrogenase